MTTALRLLVKRNLRELKRASGKTWVEIAEAIGVTERQVYRWSSDHSTRNPNEENIEALAKVFEVEPAYLYTDHGKVRRV